jgi:DNA polymerase III epsilon subunit family exonuclease
MTAEQMTPVEYSPTVIVLDVETTGLDYRTEQIIEIGAVKLQDGEVVDTFDTLVHPGKTEIRHSSFKVHGITPEMVQDAPSMETVFPKVLCFMGDLPFVAHNAIFDYSFLNEAHKRLYNSRLPNRRIDTFEMFRQVFPDAPSHGLAALMAKFGLEQDVKHRAMDDAMNLALAYPRLLVLYQQRLSWQFSQLANVPYLLERYLHLQKTVQTLQGEISDLRDVFRLYFQEGGQPLMATTGETMVSSYRRNYEYDDARFRQVVKDAGLERRALKMNRKVMDKLLYDSDIDEDIRQALRDTRTRLSETHMISIIKPADSLEVVASSEPGEISTETETTPFPSLEPPC